MCREVAVFIKGGFMRYTITVLLGVMLFSAGIGGAQALIYEGEASGKTQDAALGNLKMTALRQGVANALSKDEIKENSRLLRNEIFLKVNDFTAVQGEVSYRTENHKTYAKGKVEVNEDSIRATLQKLPLADPKASGKEASLADTEGAAADSPKDTGPEQSGALAAGEVTSAQGAGPDKAAKQETDVLPEQVSRVAPASEEQQGTDQGGAEQTVAAHSSDLTESEPVTAPKREIGKTHTTLEQDTEFIKLVKNSSTTNKAIIKALKEDGANPNAVQYLSGTQPKDTNPPLMLYLERAGKEASLAVVKAFVEMGARLDYISDDRRHALAYTVLTHSTPEIASYYFAQKPDISGVRVKPSYGHSCGLKKDEEVSLPLYFADLIYYKKDKVDTEGYQESFRLMLSLLSDLGAQEGERMLCLVRLADKFPLKSVYTRILLDAGISADAKVNLIEFRDPQPILFSALQNNDYELVQTVLDHGADVNYKVVEPNSKDKEDKTPLMFYLDYFTPGRHWARFTEEPFKLEIVKALVDKGADPLFETKDGKHSVATDLMAIGVDAYAYYLSLKPDLAGFKVNLANSWLDKLAGLKRSAEGQDALSEEQGFEIFKQQIELGCDPNYVDSRGTPLVLKAYQTGGTSYFEYLIDRVTVSAEAQDTLYADLVMEALQRNDVAVLKKLTEKQIGFNAVNKRGETLLCRGIDNGAVTVSTLEALLAGGADVNQKSGETYPLIQAIRADDRADRQDLISLLLKHKADPNLVYGKYQRTPLMLEASQNKGSAEVIGMLIDAGADVHALDTTGMDAILYAIGSASIPMLQKIEEKGGSIKKSLKLKTTVPVKQDGKTVQVEKTAGEILKEGFAEAEKKGKVNESAREFYNFLKQYL